MQTLRRDAGDAGLSVVGECADVGALVRMAVGLVPDAVVVASRSPSDALFEVARMLGVLMPCPFVVFTADHDVAKIERAASAGMHAYVVDGYAKHRLRPVAQAARARFAHQRSLQDDMARLARRFEERKVVDRAKGVLMRSRGLAEDDAFEMLRKLAMQSRQRIGVVAQSVVDMSRAGEVVNRSGQLRMFSQRIVLLRAAMALDGGIGPAPLAEAVARVDATVAMLDRAIGARGYGDLVARTAASWAALRAESTKPACTKPAGAEAAALAAMDGLAETMLGEADKLTEFLETAGLIATLKVINVAGRQRMLSQRIVKTCLLLRLAPDGARMAALVAARADFERALDYLRHAPVASAGIAAALPRVEACWAELAATLGRLDAVEALARIGAIGDELLGLTEALTDQYAQAMQTLVGDRLGDLPPGG